MAAPSYTTDLTDVNLAETTTGWSAYGGGASGLAQNPDSSMQGVYGVGKQVSAADKGQYFDNGSGITLGTGDHVYVWMFCTTPGLTDTLQNKGVSIYLGTTSANYCQYHVEGNNTYGAAGRVGKCYPIDYSVRSTNTSPPYRTAAGTPGANPQLFGGGLVTTAAVKGENCVVDAIRYGTGLFITAGDSTTPATFAGAQTTNDYNDATNGYNRWGIFTGVGGGYELQGAFVIGQNNAGTATLAYFDDSDVNISIVDTFHAASTFNKFVIDHASTQCYWTNINIAALGTTSPGSLTVNNSATTFDIVGGTFTGFGATSLQAACTVDGTTWRQSGQVTCNQATIANALFDRSSAAIALTTDDLADITGCHFIGNSNHAVELTSLGTGTMNWGNTFDTGSYAASDGSTGSETIYVNVGTGSLTINVQTGATTPTIRTAGATVTVVSGQVDVTITVRDIETNGLIQDARILVYPADNTGPLPYQESVTITRSGSTATVSHTAHGIADGKYVWISGADQEEYNGVHQITVTGANSYTYTVTGTPATPATGTIIATAAIIYGITSATGVLTDTRSYTTDQPIVGRVRKTSSTPLYSQGTVSGTVDSGAGFSTTVLLIRDD